MNNNTWMVLFRGHNAHQFNDYIDYIDDSDFAEPGAQLTQQNTRLLKQQSARKPTKNDIWIYEINVILRFTVP